MEIEVYNTILELNSCPTKYVISARAALVASYQDVYSRIRNYSKTVRVCRDIRKHLVLRGTIFPHDSVRIYQDTTDTIAKANKSSICLDEQSRWQDRRRRKVLMHTIAYVQSCVWCAFEADRWILVRQVWRRSGACPLQSDVTPSRQRENKKSFAIKRDETNTEPLSGVNGVPCRNCAPGFIVFRLPMASSGEQRQTKRKYNDSKRGRKKG